MDPQSSVFKFNNVTVYNADCREILKTIPDESVDVIITDPPYSVSEKNNIYNESSDVFFEIEDELYRVCKPDAWLVFAWNLKRIDEISRLKKFKYCWMIVEYCNDMSYNSILGQRCYGVIFVFSKGNPKIKYKMQDFFVRPYSITRHTLLSQLEKSGVKHLYEFRSIYTHGKFVQMFSDNNSVILEPFAGFGATIYACLLNQHNVKQLIAVEKDKQRFNIIKMLIQTNTFLQIHTEEILSMHKILQLIATKHY